MTSPEGEGRGCLFEPHAQGGLHTLNKDRIKKKTKCGLKNQTTRKQLTQRLQHKHSEDALKRPRLATCFSFIIITPEQTTPPPHPPCCQESSTLASLELLGCLRALRAAAAASPHLSGLGAVQRKRLNCPTGLSKTRSGF